MTPVLGSRNVKFVQPTTMTPVKGEGMVKDELESHSSTSLKIVSDVKRVLTRILPEYLQMNNGLKP